MGSCYEGEILFVWWKGWVSNFYMVFWINDGEEYVIVLIGEK